MTFLVRYFHKEVKDILHEAHKQKSLLETCRCHFRGKKSNEIILLKCAWCSPLLNPLGLTHPLQASRYNYHLFSSLQKRDMTRSKPVPLNGLLPASRLSFLRQVQQLLSHELWCCCTENPDLSPFLQWRVTWLTWYQNLPLFLRNTNRPLTNRGL